MFMKMVEKLMYIELRICGQSSLSSDVARIWWQGAIECKTIGDVWRWTENQLTRFAEAKRSSVSELRYHFLNICLGHLKDEIEKEKKEAEEGAQMSPEQRKVYELQIKIRTELEAKIETMTV